MKKLNNRGFTLVELIIVFVIIGILSGISYVSSSMIYQSNLESKILELKVFINSGKGKIIKDKNSMFYLILNKNTDNKNYVYSYLKKNNCNDFGIEDLYNDFAFDGEMFYLTGNILDNLVGVNGYHKITDNKFERIEGLDSNYSIAGDEDVLRWDIYGTGIILEGGNTYESVLKCGEIEIFNLNSNLSNIYELNTIGYGGDRNYNFSDKIILEYSLHNLKPNLYDTTLSSGRKFYDNFDFSVKNTQQNIVSTLKF